MFFANCIPIFSNNRSSRCISPSCCLDVATRNAKHNSIILHVCCNDECFPKKTQCLNLTDTYYTGPYGTVTQNSAE